MPGMDNVTIPNVELLKTGTWNASTGEVTITSDDLQDILSAWESRDLPLAVIKIGHTDPRFDNPDWDGEPAYGQVDNLRINDEEDGSATLVGDYINVPSELAEKLPSAYPQRSVEIDWEVELRDQDDNVVQSYPAVLTGLALLGQSAPAVKGLADVHSAFKQRKSSLSVHHAGRSTRLTALLSYPGGHTSDSLRQALSEALRDQTKDAEFIWVEDFDDETVWFTGEIHAEDGYTSHTWQQAYEVSDSGAVTITGDAVRVQARRTYAPIPDADLSEQKSVPHGQAPGTESAGMGARHQTDAASSQKSDEGEPMEFTAEQLAVLREKFGLTENATSEDVLEAINQEGDSGEEAEEPGSEPNDEEDESGDDNPDEEPSGADLSAAKFKAPAGTVLLTEDRFQEMQSQLTALSADNKARKDREDKDRRDGTIRVALSEGRIVPREASKWRKALDENETTTASLLSSLPKGHSFPTEEIGSEKADYFMDADTVIDEKTAEMDAQFFGKGGK